MGQTTADVIVPFRDRGKDPNRPANLERVTAQWKKFGYTVHVVDDGREGDEQFNRSAAYNNGAKVSDAEVLIYSESDLLVPIHQIVSAITLATLAPGLVVPFSRFMAINEADSKRVRAQEISFESAKADQIRSDCKSIGAVNIVSRATLESIGQWDENFQGAWYDDDSMERAFTICAAPTRFVTGKAWHLYHLSGAIGDHLSEEDIRATENNRRRWERYLAARTPEDIRALTGES